LARSDAQHKVVFGHHPFRSNGPHGNAGAYEGWSYIPWLSGASLERLFTATLCDQADVYLSGHDHNLQWTTACAVELVVSGSGAKTRPIVDRGNPMHFAEAAPGFVWLELSESAQIAFYDQEAGLRFQGQL
jgi:hypothetical protein